MVSQSRRWTRTSRGPARRALQQWTLHQRLVDNGLSTNGLSTNDLSTNGLSTNGFATWFSQDPATAGLGDGYVVMRGAVRAGETVANPLTGTLHTWNGALGLAPDWAAGSRGGGGQEVISACLAAHANK